MGTRQSTRRLPLIAIDREKRGLSERPSKRAHLLITVSGKSPDFAVPTFFRARDSGEESREIDSRDNWNSLRHLPQVGGECRVGVAPKGPRATFPTQCSASGFGDVLTAAAIYHRRHHPSLAAGNLYLHPRLIWR